MKPGAMKKENYEIIHQILQKKQFASALSLLLDPATGRVRRKFADDLNHAWYLLGDARYRLGELQKG